MTPPVLILSPRISDDTVKLWRAAGRMGWDVERLASWRLPFELSDQRGRDVVLYGGLMFLIAEELDVALLEPPLDWLTTVPPQHLRREITFTTLADAGTRRARSSSRPTKRPSRPASMTPATCRPATCCRPIHPY